MPRPTPAPANGTWQTKSELIVGYLDSLALPSMGNRLLTTKDYAVWDKLLEPFSKDAISFAFETWVRNATGSSKFPQPATIIRLAETHHVDEQKDEFKSCGRCYDGWLYSRDDPARYRLGMKRCPCFLEYVERKKAA